MGLGVSQAGQIKPLGSFDLGAGAESVPLHTCPQSGFIFACGEGWGSSLLSAGASERQGQLSQGSEGQAWLSIGHRHQIDPSCSWTTDPDISLAATWAGLTSWLWVEGMAIQVGMVLIAMWLPQVAAPTWASM